MADRDEQIMRQGRQAALVIAVAMLAWIALQWIGAEAGIAPRFMLLFDLAALAAFIWALVVAARVWRYRQGK